MKIEINGTPKEIADLVTTLKGQPLTIIRKPYSDNFVVAKPDGNLSYIPTEQLITELKKRNEANVYNCDRYKDNNYRVTISKAFGDYGNVSVSNKCDVIIINRKSDRPNNAEK